jgi:hypothetical protein
MNGPTPIQVRLRILKLRADHPDLTVRAIALRMGVNEKTVGQILRVATTQKPALAPRTTDTKDGRL